MAVPRVLLVVIDGCTPRILGPALARGELPCLAALAAAGSLDLECTSIFPSITPAATASIVTGRHPADHGIAGMSWLNPEEGDVSYFGDDVATVLQRGPADFLSRFLIELNGDRLRAPTIMQTAERHGIAAGSFNYVVFRGDVSYEATPPSWLRLWPFMPHTLSICGPSVFRLGEFVGSPDRRLLRHRGIRHRFGLDDAATEDFLVAFSGAEALPPFSIAYFADYDFEAHDRGPVEALDVLHALDRRLQHILDAWGGLERVLRHTAIVVTADHCHSEVGQHAEAGIALEQLLGELRLGDPASGWKESDHAIVCPNMRAAQIHVRGRDEALTRRIVELLLRDRRNDQVIWREGDGDEAAWYQVITADRGAMRFSVGNGAGAVRDAHGAAWRCQGDLAAVDADVTAGEIRFGAYPNAFERIAGGLSHLRGGHLWVTARPGFEFAAAGQRPHKGAGSHGALHESDSLVPLLVAGAASAAPPRPARIVDVEPLCRQILGLPPPATPGTRR
jgi:hypothetical protein